MSTSSRYKKSLEEDIAHHTTGDFRKLLVPLVSAFRYEGDEVNMALAKSEAKLLHEKICDKAYADEEIIRMLTTRSKAQLNATLNQYNDHVGNAITKLTRTMSTSSRYKKSLEEDIAHHTTGDFRKLLVPLVSAFRYEGDEVNMALAKSEAKLLHEKICDKAYADEEIIRMLTTRSKAQLNATLNQYNDHVGNAITKRFES
ncbi:hypothetical protein OROHE_024234 [Orobanche hederae]